MTDWLLPIRPRWAWLVLLGEKTVEVRRNVRVAIRRDDRLWLYVTAPVRQVMGSVRVSHVRTDSALRQSRRIGGSCLSHREYWRYARADGERLTLIWLEAPARLAAPRPLADLALAHPPRSIRALEASAVRVLTEEERR